MKHITVPERKDYLADLALIPLLHRLFHPTRLLSKKLPCSTKYISTSLNPMKSWTSAGWLELMFNN